MCSVGGEHGGSHLGWFTCLADAGSHGASNSTTRISCRTSAQRWPHNDNTLGLFVAFVECHSDIPGYINVLTDELKYLYSKANTPKAAQTVFLVQLPVICGVLFINHRARHHGRLFTEPGGE